MDGPVAGSDLIRRGTSVNMSAVEGAKVDALDLRGHIVADGSDSFAIP